MLWIDIPYLTIACFIVVGIIICVTGIVANSGDN